MNLIDVDQVPVLPVDWKWYLNCALMNLAGWLLLFSALYFLTYYMQEEPASHILNSDPAPDMARYGPAPGIDTAMKLVAPPQPFNRHSNKPDGN